MLRQSSSKRVTRHSSSARALFTAVLEALESRRLLAAVPIDNPSFEDPTLSDGQNSSSVPSWTFSMSSGYTGAAYVTNPTSTQLYEEATNGSNVARIRADDVYYEWPLENAATLKQVLSSDLEASTTYNLQASVGFPTDALSDPTVEMQLLAGGEVLQTTSIGLYYEDMGAQYAISLTYTSPTSSALIGEPLEIRFLVGAGGWNGYAGEATIDHVRLDATEFIQPAPATPTGLAARGSSANHVFLKWTDQSNNEASFEIQRKQPDNSWLTVQTVAANTTYWSDSGLTPNTNYTYRVRARGTGSQPHSNWTNEVIAPTRGPLPEIDDFEPASVVNWLPFASDYSSSYLSVIPGHVGAGAMQVEYYLGGDETDWAGAGFFNAWYAAQSWTSYSGIEFDFQGQATGRTMYFEVQDNSSSGASGAKEKFVYSFVDNSSGWQHLSIPFSSFVRKWTQDAGAPDDGFGRTEVWGVGVFVLTTDYEYGDGAFALDGIELSSTTAVAPSDLTATAIAARQIDLAWEDNSTDETGFKIERKTAGGTWSQIAAVGADVTEFSDFTVLSEKTYTYRIRATNSVAGTNSAYSNEASATTPVAPVTAPTGLTAQAALDPLRVNLNWNDNPSAQDVVEYIIYRSLTANFADAIDIDVSPTSDYSDESVGPGTVYYYWVTGVSDTGFESEPSNMASVTTGVPAPTNLQLDAVHDTEVNLSWADTIDADPGEDGFYIEAFSTAPGTPAVSVTVAPNATGYTLIGLKPDRQYTVRIQAKRGAYGSAWETATVTTPPEEPWESLGTVRPGIFNDNTAMFGTFPAGLYRIVYDSDSLNFSVDLPNWWGTFSYRGVHSNNVYTEDLTNVHGGTQGEVEARSVGLGKSFDHAGGQIGVRFTDAPYYDNAGDGVKWRLERRIKPVVSIAATKTDAKEVGDDDEDRKGTFTVTRSGNTDGDLVVHLHPPAGTARPGSTKDYDGFPQTVTIEDGDPSATFDVLPFGDAVPEPTETIVGYLKGGGSYLVAAAAGATVNIADGPTGADLGFNHSNSDADDSDPHDTLREGTPDVKFVIDEADEEVEEDGTGFEFWWSRNTGGERFQAQDLTDLIPFRVLVPDALKNAGGSLKLKMEYVGPDDAVTAYVYKSEASSEDRTAFLSDPGIAGTQVENSAKATRSLLYTNFMSRNHKETRLYAVGDIEAGSNEYLIRFVGSETARVTLTLLWTNPTETSTFPLDKSILTIRPSEMFYSLVSARGTKDAAITAPSEPFLYRSEGGRTEQINRFPYQVIRDTHRDDIDNTLVYIHGYNNNFSEAENTFSTVLKRLYWQGFRGNFVGFSWFGDQGAPLFDPNVDNALHTSPALWSFLRNVLENDTEAGGWGLAAADVNIAAHSLGNLVMWDAIRLNGRITPNDKLVNNVVSIEAAVWSEAFAASGEVVYNDSHPITYTAAELETMSWHHWFNPGDINIKDSITGKVFNSYYAEDEALGIAMRLNDMNSRAPYHDPRQQGLPPRTASNLYNLPALLVQRPLFYTSDDLSLPAGMVPIPIADRNIDSALYGWDNVDGQNAIPGAGDNGHSDHAAEPYFKTFNWWKYVFAGNGDSSWAAVPIGRE
jgi:fibronectin type 3 domain-containing protein